VHAQTCAVYELLDELRQRHPGVEIESCASGGARVDLGILARTDRVWPSDTNDALERQIIQRWTGQLLPPELIGAHIGPPKAHTTGRTHSLSFRVATALFGHLGIEWDITTATTEEIEGLREAIDGYKRLRHLLHGGDVVRGDHVDPAVYVHGVVAPDRTEAVFAFVQLASPVTEMPGPIRLIGLDLECDYRVTPLLLAGGPQAHEIRSAPWLTEGGVTVSGRVLEVVGLQMPILLPEHALLLHLVAEPTGADTPA
jgi:alpha-galactosidase